MNERKVRQAGFALPLVLVALSALVLVLVAMLLVARAGRAGAAMHADQLQAELAAESGLAAVEAQVDGFLRREPVGGAGFTTWAYFPAGDEQAFAVALSSGRPPREGSAWLDEHNTIWLGTVVDPDQTYQLRGDPETVVDLNAGHALALGWGPMRARWQTVLDAAGEPRMRFAAWVDDETSRIDLALAGRRERGAGVAADELEVPGDVGLLGPAQQEEQASWPTPASAAATLGPQLAAGLDFMLTIGSRGNDVLAHAPQAAAGGPAVARRGMRKLNVNWSWLVDAQVPADERVGWLADWLEAAAPEFFAYGAPGFWQGTGTSAPDEANPLGVVAGTLADRREQMRTIAASLIDSMDADCLPTQPAWLAALDLANPPLAPGGVLFMQAVRRPEFFGADRCARLNEAQVIWNCRGAADQYLANPEVARVSVAPGVWEYTIPVTWRIELWNMDREPIPPQAYAVRVLSAQQIDSFAFGAIGSAPIPEETELVLELNSGNPVGLGPGEVRVFDVTRTFTRRSVEDRGTTWNSFRLGGAGTQDDQPNGHSRQAMVLLAADSGAWLSAATYQQLTQAPVDGVCSAGIGNKGDLKGNKINDPRLVPLRWYTPATLSPTVHNPERDANSNKPGRLGAVNNLTGAEQFNFQNFNFWGDRPRFASLLDPQEGVTAVPNRPMLSLGELGQILDPGWVHPTGRGGGAADNYAYHAGLTSPFRGGGSLAAGQPQRRSRLGASSWSLLDVVSLADPAQQFGNPEWRGRVNVNVPKRVVSSDGRVFDNLEWVLRLPRLERHAAGAPDAFFPERLVAGVRRRLTRGELDDGTPVRSWRDARPFTSLGHLSELDAWVDPRTYQPGEERGDGRAAALNRSDAGREEMFCRSANLLTTQSHSYRVFVRGETLRGGQVVARATREVLVRFTCDYDAQSGRLLKVTPQRLRTMVR